MANAGAPSTSASVSGPRHVAIIMDGNGRWASARSLPRVEGHRRGVEALRRTVRAAAELGIEYVTIFSFSSENWSRPLSEINDLFGLLRRFIGNDLAELHRDGVRVRVIGEREGLAEDIRSLLNEAEELTRDNTRMTHAPRAGLRRKWPPARAIRRRSRPRRYRSLSTPLIFPIPISSSAPVANSVCPTSCCGKALTANSSSCRCTGRISIAPRSKAPSRSFAGANGASAGSPL